MASLVIVTLTSSAFSALLGGDVSYQVLCAGCIDWVLPYHRIFSLAGNLPPIQTVFIILMENHNWSTIKGSSSAPYINNTLLPMSSWCAKYYNPPGIHPSEPNYLWLRRGRIFGITNDSDPSSNHQATPNHLATLLNNANISWKTYQESISGTWCRSVSSGE